MLVLLSVLLLSSSALPLIQSLQCNETTEYLKGDRCCKKCKPGEQLQEKCKKGSHDTLCTPCLDGFFTKDFNIYFEWCSNCKMCTKEHMKYEKHCTPTSDAECTCDEGYRCSGKDCQMCVKVQTPPTSTKNPFTTQNKYKKCTWTSDGKCTCGEGYQCRDSPCQICVKVQNLFAPTKTPPHTQNNVWISVSLCFACVCVCVLFNCFRLISRKAQPFGWIMSVSAGFWLSKKRNSRPRECTDEEQVPMPVQEMCGKAEKLEDD